MKQFKCKRCGKVVVIKVGNCPECSSDNGWDKIYDDHKINGYDNIKRGIDYSKDNFFDAIGRPDLKKLYKELNQGLFLPFFAKEKIKNHITILHKEMVDLIEMPYYGIKEFDKRFDLVIKLLNEFKEMVKK